MNIRITQREIGQFNLCSSEKTFSFYMSIYDGNSIVMRDGVRAQLHYSGEPKDIQYFEDAVENISDVFERCIKYAGRVWSSTDYFAQCMVFANVYHDNFDQITVEYVENRNRHINQQIEKLQKELADDYPLSTDLYEVFNWVVQEKIKQYTRWANDSQKELEQIKEGTEKYAEVSKKIEGFRKNIDEFTAKIIPQPIEND